MVNIVATTKMAAIYPLCHIGSVSTKKIQPSMISRENNTTSKSISFSILLLCWFIVKHVDYKAG